MFDYAELAGTALELLEEFGQAVTIQAAALSPEYDPATGTVAGGLLTSYTGTGAVFDYATRDIDGTQVQAGDQRLLLAVTCTDGTDMPEPVAGNLAVLGSTTWRVMNSRPLAPGGVTVVHEVQLRR